MHSKKQTIEESIILKISGGFSLCLLAFSLVFAFHSDWVMATLDLFATSTSAVLCIRISQP